MGRKKTVPDTVSAQLDYELALLLATQVEHSDEYDSRADFVRDALWEKLKRDHGTSDVLDEFIDRQEDILDNQRAEARRAIREYENEVETMRALKKDRDEAVVSEADEFFDQLEDADIER